MKPAYATLSSLPPELASLWPCAAASRQLGEPLAGPDEKPRALRVLAGKGGIAATDWHSLQRAWPLLGWVRGVSCRSIDLAFSVAFEIHRSYQ